MQIDVIYRLCTDMSSFSFFQLRLLWVCNITTPAYRAADRNPSEENQFHFTFNAIKTSPIYCSARLNHSIENTRKEPMLPDCRLWDCPVIITPRVTRSVDNTTDLFLGHPEAREKATSALIDWLSVNEMRHVTVIVESVLQPVFFSTSLVH